MSPDISKARTHGCGFGPWSSSGSAVLVQVDGEPSEELAGDGVGAADVEVADEQDDAGSGVASGVASGVGSSGAEVAQPRRRSRWSNQSVRVATYVAVTWLVVR